MGSTLAIHKRIVAALFAVSLLMHGAEAQQVPQDPALDGLFSELADPSNEAWGRAAADIQRIWSRSGSAAMDLLLKRGEQALDTGDLPTAIAHLTALTDHDPDFAEGWNARATAYYMRGDYGQALADIAKTLTLQPRHWGALAGLGAILDDMGETKKALAAYQASLALNPHQDDVTDAVARLEGLQSGTSL
jgi:Flp pilus assembly protein TadD